MGRDRRVPEVPSLRLQLRAHHLCQIFIKECYDTLNKGSPLWSSCTRTSAFRSSQVLATLETDAMAPYPSIRTYIRYV